MTPGSATSAFFCQPLPRPRIGTSACLAGEPVRYDGSDKYQTALYAHIAPHADLLPLCPEAGAGLGIPRPPVRLVDDGQVIRARGVNDPHLDVTTALHAFNARTLPMLSSLSGFILKARSPSCGWKNTPLYDDAGRPTGLTSGLFAQALQQAMPWLPVCDEEELQDEGRAAHFLYRARLTADVLAAKAHKQLEACLTHHHTQGLPEPMVDAQAWLQKAWQSPGMP